MKKEHTFLKILIGVLIIMAGGIIGTVIAHAEIGGTIGVAIGGFISFFIFILKNPSGRKETKAE